MREKNQTRDLLPTATGMASGDATIAISVPWIATTRDRDRRTTARCRREIAACTGRPLFRVPTIAPTDPAVEIETALLCPTRACRDREQGPCRWVAAEEPSVPDLRPETRAAVSAGNPRDSGTTCPVVLPFIIIVRTIHHHLVAAAAAAQSETTTGIHHPAAARWIGAAILPWTTADSTGMPFRNGPGEAAVAEADAVVDEEHPEEEVDDRTLEEAAEESTGGISHHHHPDGTGMLEEIRVWEEEDPITEATKSAVPGIAGVVKTSKALILPAPEIKGTGNASEIASASHFRVFRRTANSPRTIHRSQPVPPKPNPNRRPNEIRQNHHNRPSRQPQQEQQQHRSRSKENQHLPRRKKKKKPKPRVRDHRRRHRKESRRERYRLWLDSCNWKHPWSSRTRSTCCSSSGSKS